ncbi:hypothetical protein TVAG_391750 [Trichomonas vaginalis G3]|uniref:Uncharacterized protein n=1 Tax=Trichomonas vaginalis (strain ATCC PRA-98 / G3) TaxID=412133 RepID=A2DFT8_TRIV3|nr:ankyrin repeat and EF-Hand domain-containing protein 1 family [Trichomonas vaginalis G3]EAY20791.1 hypothetical protein TVAG_391750 [Trichomonas vaginalis G3]KAI5529405.1 ankyrin repeat and EF-Hand domain-containing protein 1 family [Trichomonas vaginalis G3]|eukprot:XP_001581777.1 hypothetical protein [Trichomonas vaginalis G3]
MVTFKSFSNPLRIILLFTPVDLTGLSPLIPLQMERRNAIPDETKEEIWKFIEKNIYESSEWFKAVYSVIMNIKPINKMENLSDLLFIAVRLGNFDIIQELIIKGAKINSVEGIYNRLSPSLEAISKDRSDILQLFINNGLDVNSIYSRDNFTLINASIEYNSMKCFDILIEKASLNHIVVQTPMMVALQTFERTGNDYFINKLLDKIDIEYETIVDSSFVNYTLFKEGKIPEFHYTSDHRFISPVVGLNYQPIRHNLDNTDVVQKSLATGFINRLERADIKQNFFENLKDRNAHFP